MTISTERLTQYEGPWTPSERYTGPIDRDQPEIRGLVSMLEEVDLPDQLQGRVISFGFDSRRTNSPKYASELRQRVVDMLEELDSEIDPDTVRLAAAELIGNAYDHSLSGPIRITVAAIDSRPEITITVYNEDDPEVNDELEGNSRVIKIGASNDPLLKELKVRDLPPELADLPMRGRGRLILDVLGKAGDFAFVDTTTGVCGLGAFVLLKAGELPSFNLDDYPDE